MAVRAAPLITCSYKGIGACSAVRDDRRSDGGAAWLPPTLLPGGPGGPGAWLGAGVAGCSVLLAAVPGLGGMGREGGASSRV